MDALWIPIVMVMVMVMIVAVIAFMYAIPRSINGKPDLFLQNSIKIKKEGKLLYKTNCGGSIGSANFTLKLLDIEIYNTGIIITSGLFPTFCILKDEITDLRMGKTLFSSGTQVVHTAQNIEKYILIYVSLSNEIKEKLLK